MQVQKAFSFLTKIFILGYTLEGLNNQSWRVKFEIIIEGALNVLNSFSPRKLSIPKTSTVISRVVAISHSIFGWTIERIGWPGMGSKSILFFFKNETSEV